MSDTFDPSSIYIALDHDILPQLVDYCHMIGDRPFLVVADQNTWPIFGKAVADSLLMSGAQVGSVVLEGEHIVADERAVAQVIAAISAPTILVAVGSGTLTDITRYATHHTHNVFLSVPTAPSVDGFTSVVAAMTFGGLKVTVPAQPPVAVFADLDILRTAPQPMIAAGFGDMVAKYTSLADWKLGALVWDEEYDEAIAARVQAALAACSAIAREVGKAGDDAVHTVMSGLIESGLCMVEFGRSIPASGAEHHISHYLEMKLLREGRPPILHGAKVGVGTVAAARRYEWLSQMPRQQMLDRLEGLTLPDRAAEVERIRAGFGPAAEEVIAAQSPFLDMDEVAFGVLKSRIAHYWDDIQSIARLVPPSKVINDLIRIAGGPKDHRALGLTDDDLTAALTYAPYVRPHFTINRLSGMLGIA